MDGRKKAIETASATGERETVESKTKKEEAEEEKDEDSLVVADVLDLEEEEVISSLISSLFPSTSLESVMGVETSDLPSLLE